MPPPGATGEQLAKEKVDLQSPSPRAQYGRVDLKMGDNRLITDTLSYFDIARNNAGYVICNM